jgi:hypothetical protein
MPAWLIVIIVLLLVFAVLWWVIEFIELTPNHAMIARIVIGLILLVGLLAYMLPFGHGSAPVP